MFPSTRPIRRPLAARSSRGAFGAVLAAAFVIAVAACSPSPSASPTLDIGPSGATDQPSPSGPAASVDAAAVYAEIAAQVEAIRGLEPTADVAPVLIDEAQLRANLTADFDAQNPAAAIVTSERTLKALGLLDPGASLRAAYLDLQAGQVAGYYSPERNELFVVSRSGGIGVTQKVTYAHEFTHQLQDQNFDLGALGLDAPDQGDRSLARLCLVEGDAVSAQATWMTSHLSTEELGQLLSDSLDPAALAALQRAPAILRETALFPYQGGQAFVAGLLAGGGEAAVDAAFGDPPGSTEQILHPEKFATRERPIAVHMPTGLAAGMGAGWAASGDDTLGELVTGIWLHHGGLDPATANAAAAGWGGDRLELLTGPDGATALALVSEWDTPADAAEFALAARTAMAGYGLVGDVEYVAGSTRVGLAIGANVDVLAGLLAA